MPDISCQKFADFLIRYEPHYDKTIIRDVTPVQGWVGHVSVGGFPANAGVSQIFHRVNRMFPDMSGCWEDVTAEACVGTPCDPDPKLVGFGFTQDSYSLQQADYATDLFCFDLIMSADRAVEQFEGVIKGLREATLWINNHRFRTEALRIAKYKVLAGAGLQNATYTISDDCTTITLNALPTSKLTIQFLQRWVSILTGEGYVGENPLPHNLMFELVTDMITANNLLENNPALADFLRVSTPEMFGKLYKYGITSMIGNFGIRMDLWPLRYQIVSGTTLNLVLPYENSPATEGIKAEYNYSYDQARVQVDFIWHRMAMRALVRDPRPINSQMPFAVRDFGGRWFWVMNNMTCRDADGNVTPVNNELGNKGKFRARFSNAIKAEHPEWVVAIFSLRELSCVTDSAPCQSAYPYITQDYSSANEPCPNADVDFALCVLGVGEGYVLEQVECNGVPLLETDTEYATAALLATGLNTNFSALGTWSAPTASSIRLSGSTCANPSITVTCAA